MPGGPLPSLASPGCRAVIIATASHPGHSLLPSVPSVATTAERLGRVLVERCGLAPGALRIVHDPRTPQDAATAIMETAADAADVLLVYYIGHGVLSLSGELYLAVHDTDALRPGAVAAYEALPYSAVRDALVASPARSVAVVLDCCFSGRAGPPRRRECVVLASAGGEEVALAPPDAELTTFTGGLVELLERGDPAGPRWLTVGHAVRWLRRRHEASGAPLPYITSVGSAADLVLAGNAGYAADAGDTGGEPPAPANDAESPYRGLAGYGVDDAAVFFGRTEQTRSLLELTAARVYRPRPLVLVGGSGSGKSSLLRAGLLSAVRRGELGVPGSVAWPTALMTPGSDPVAALARRLAPILARPAATVAEELRTAPARTARRLSSRRPGTAGSAPWRLMLVVDQLEEMFSLCRSTTRRRRFVAALRALAEPAPDGAEPPVLVVLGVRADFYARCAGYAWLAGALRDSQVLMAPMTRAQLHDVVTGPAGVAGLRVEAGLTEVVLRDAGAAAGASREAGVLPLLSHALLATWQGRRGDLLTVEAYQASGGIAGAIAQTAETLYHDLDAEGRAALQRLLLRLVAVTDDAPPTRNRVRRADLARGGVLDRLIKLRLVTVDDTYVEIAHEALIREWARLDAWIRENAADLALRRQVGAAAQAWDGEGRHDAGLYAGPRLAAVRPWLDRPGLSTLEREFLTASVRAARRRVARRYAVAGALTVAVALVAGVAVYALQQRHSLADQRADATVRNLLSAEARLRTTDSLAAQQAGLAAVRLGGGRAATDALRTTLTGPHYVAGFDGAVEAYDPVSATALVSSGPAGDGAVWDLTDPRRPQAKSTPACDRLPGGETATPAAISPGGHLAGYLHGIDYDGTVPAGTTQYAGTDLVLCDLDRPDAKPVSVTRVVGTADVGHPYQLVGDTTVFSPDGHRVAVAGGFGGPLTLVDTATGGTVALPRPPPEAPDESADGAFAAAAFSADGQVLAAVFDRSPGRDIKYGAVLVVYDLAGPGSPRRAAAVDISTGGRPGAAYAIAFRSSGRVVAVGADHAVQLWNLDQLDRPVRLTDLGAGADSYWSVAFNSTGTILAAQTAQGVVGLWSVDRPESAAPLGTVGVPDYGRLVGFAADGRTVIARGSGKTVLLDVGAPNLVARLDRIGDPAISPDGDLLAGLAETGDDETGDDPPRPAAVAVWQISDPAHPRLVTTLDTGVPGARWVGFAPTGRRLLVIGASAAVLDLTDPSHPTRVAAWSPWSGPDPQPLIDGVAVNPAGDLLALGTTDGLTLWSMPAGATPAKVASLPYPQKVGLVDMLAFRDGGRILLVLSEGGITSWDVSDPAGPRELGTIETSTENAAMDPAGPGIGKAVSADGTVMATSYANGITDLWRLDRGRPSEPFASMDHGSAADTTLLSGGGVFVEAGEDDTLSFWDTRASTPPEVLSVGTPGGIDAMALTADQRTLATADGTGVWLWNVAGVLAAVTDPVAVACAQAGPAMPASLWSTYAPGVRPRPLC
ncbi:caspase, EACC1-associated type [Dactylosporangium sp. CA-092794]|uniref:caspase, EACC1-associated type n=1 Tax=Dactylosporangium sp. CA-092794 TaxID=3239929 RepID=UPI003D8D7236